MARALETPFAAQPSALAQPVPGQEQIENIDALFQEFQSTQQAQLVMPDALQKLFDEQQPPDELFKEFQEFQKQQAERRRMVTELQPGSALDFFERAKLSFAQTETEQRAFLESIPGVTKVEFKDGEPTITRNGKKKRVDPDDFEFFADLFADIARPAMEALVETPFVLAGAMGAGLPGLVAGGAAGGLVATTIGDFVQEKLIGPLDPERDLLLERSIATGLGGVLSFAGGLLTNFLKKPAKQTLRQIAKANREAALTSPEQVRNVLAQSSDDFRQLLAQLKETGINIETIGTDGKPLQFTLSNLEINDPAVKQAVTDLLKKKEFVNIQAELGESLTEQLDLVLEDIGNTAGVRNFRAAAETDTNIVEKVTSFVSKLKRDEGIQIGKFKMQAGKQFNKDPQIVPNVQEKLTVILNKLDIIEEPTLLKEMTQEQFAIRLNLKDKTIASGKFKGALQGLLEEFVNKEMKLTPADFENIIPTFEAVFENASTRADKKLWLSLNDITRGLRQDRIDVVEKGLEGSGLEGQFREAMGKFSSLSKNIGEVSEIIAGDALGSEAFISSIFKAKTVKDAVSRLKAARAVIQGNNNDLWKDLTGQLLNDIIAKASKGGKPPTFRGVAEGLNRLGREGQQIILKGSGRSFKTLKNLLNVAQQVERTNLDAISRSEQEEIVRAMIKVNSGFVDTSINAARTLWRAVFPSKKLDKLLTQTGMEEFIAKEVGGSMVNKRRIRTRFRDLIELSQPGLTGVRLGGEAAVREEVREESRGAPETP